MSKQWIPPGNIPKYIDLTTDLYFSPNDNEYSSLPQNYELCKLYRSSGYYRIRNARYLINTLASSTSLSDSYRQTDFFIIGTISRTDGLSSDLTATVTVTTNNTTYNLPSVTIPTGVYAKTFCIKARLTSATSDLGSATITFENEGSFTVNGYVISRSWH